MEEEAVLNKQATLLQERTSALLTSLESGTSALPPSVQPHVTPRSGGGEKSVLSEGTLRVPKAYYRGQVGDSLAQRDAELEALDRGVRRPRILYSYGMPPPELSNMEVQEMQSANPSAECAKIGAIPDPEVGPKPEPLRGRSDFVSRMRVSGPCAECVTDVPGLQCVTDVPGQSQNSCSVTGGQASQSLVSMLVRVMLGIVVAYGESREVRSVIDPVLSVVGEKVLAEASEASRKAGRAAVETGRLLRHHAARASQALGQRVVEATVASGKAVLAAGSRIVCGEPPEAKIGIVGMTSLPSSQRRQAAPLYEFVGEKRSDAGNRPLHPNIVTVPQTFDPARAATEGF